MGREEGVVGDDIGVGSLVEQVAGDVGVGFFGVGRNDGIEGEDVWVGDFVEHLAGEGEMAASGVEVDEVVGEVGGRGDLGFDVEGLEGSSCGEVSVRNAGFQELAKAFEGRRRRRHCLHLSVETNEGN